MLNTLTMLNLRLTDMLDISQRVQEPSDRGDILRTLLCRGQSKAVTRFVGLFQTLQNSEPEFGSRNLGFLRFIFMRGLSFPRIDVVNSIMRVFLPLFASTRILTIKCPSTGRVA